MSKQREALKTLYSIIREPPMSPLEHRLADIIEEALVEPTKKPLTDDEVMSLALQHDLNATWSKELFEFVRAIERVHGIVDTE